MQINERQHGAVTVLKPIGPVCEDDAEALKTRALEASKKNLGRLVLDTSGSMRGEAMKRAMQRGERIELRGFGIFQVKPRKKGIGRNPRTGREVRIPPGKTIRFKPGKNLRNLT